MPERPDHQPHLPADRAELTLHDGDILYRRGDVHPFAYKLLTGNIHILATTDKGSAFLIHRIRPGMWFHTEYALTATPAPGDAVAQGTTTLHRVPATDLAAQLENLQGDLPAIIGSMSRTLLVLTSRFRSHSLETVRTSLVRYLLKMADKHAAPHLGAHAPIGFDILTGDALASLLGTTRESVSRALSALVKDHLIVKNARHISIPDITALRSQSGSDSP